MDRVALAAPALAVALFAGAARAENAPAAPTDPARPLFAVAPSVSLGTRHFAYSDGASPALRGYDLPAAPLVGVQGEIYPLARASRVALGALGLAARYERAVGVASTTTSASPDQLAATPSQTVDTSWSSFDVALRGRLPVTRAVTLGARVGYGVMDFSFTGADALAASLPAVTYRFARGGVDARVAMWRVALVASFDGLAVLDGGAVASRFARAHVTGVDAAAAFALPLAEHVEVRSGARYQRFFYSMSSRPGDALVADGAADELAYWENSLVVAY